jgi:ribosome recycling factor
MEVKKMFPSFRNYHNSSFQCKPKKSTNTTVSVDVSIPNLKEAESSVDLVIDKFVTEIAKIRGGGGTSVELFGSIAVESYGTVANAGQVTLKSSSTVSIAVYDPSMVKIVAEAVRKNEMNLNVAVEGNIINIAVPKPSKESRDAMSKTVGKLAEKVWNK